MNTATTSSSNAVLIVLLIAIVMALAVYIFMRDDTETLSINTPAGRIEATVPRQ